MLQDIVRGILQTILRDKILLGLLIVGVIAVVSAGAAKDEKKPSEEGPAPGGQQAHAHGQQAPAQGQQPHSQQQQAAQAHSMQLEEAKLAKEFVHWWLSGAMDYSAATCQNSHAEMFNG